MQKVEIKQIEMDFRSKEAYKTLRTNIEFSGENVKVVYITSCTPSEGKSTISFELAQSCALNGMKTLLIDADLRRSVLKSKSKKSKSKSGKLLCGLTNYLVGRGEIDDVICESDIPLFNLVFAGPVPPNPSELLGNARFAKLIEKAREMYDIVIVDTPPIGSVIDAVVVSKYCDGGIMVIESGVISYRFAYKMKEQLELADCKLLGCVLNKVNLSGKGYYGKYYGNYYGKYYGKYYGNYTQSQV